MEEIQKLKAENERLHMQIEENNQRIASLQKALIEMEIRPSPPEILIPEYRVYNHEAWGEGEPPVKGAVPAHTYRDKDGNIRIALCRTYAGEGWRYTPVADGWMVVTHESDHA